MERLTDERVAEYAAMSEQERGFHDFSGETVFLLAVEVQGWRAFAESLNAEVREKFWRAEG
jgi:hypothetical protein